MFRHNVCQSANEYGRAVERLRSMHLDAMLKAGNQFGVQVFFFDEHTS